MCTSSNPTYDWLFSYDGDGTMVGQLVTDGTTATQTRFFMGGAYESTSDGTTETVRKYYAIAGQTFAMSDNGVMKYLLTDHLGSTVAVTDAAGTLLSETRYMPFGEPRADVGLLTGTDKTYTGQRDVPTSGLMDYKARMYSPWLGRFIQPDSMVPGAGNPQSWNRYSYVLGNPILYTDPSGHNADCGIGDQFCDELKHEFGNKWKENINISTKEWEMVKHLKKIREMFNSNNLGSLSDLDFPEITWLQYESEPYGYNEYLILNQQIKSSPYMLTYYDYKLVSWTDIYLDLYGIAADLSGVLQPGATGLEIVKIYHDLALGSDLISFSGDVLSFIPNDSLNTDLVSTVLDGASIAPEIGAVPSLLDIFYQLSEGFYQVPYQPVKE